MDVMSSVSTKPYLLRALFDWCADQGLTPYIAVVVDERAGVPRQYVKDGQIILNIGREAVHQLVMGNELITCSARFGGVAQELTIPIDCVAAIYARENGHGMAFEVTPGQTVRADLASAPLAERSEQAVLTTPEKPAARPHLRRIK
ncbi:MAG: ClpXP protease specificity-enhancing factor [Gammaproteobacteria bacterium]|jgi:stringent starvation protein B|nr:ClpXP protease specificity-enhancing factor [Gammaproteobacteria bacterium]MBU0772048.1 ClpXP protease specificity-enhancing factor [Gammaproteobacteria bacterium]MBU0856403.1 ClpXP protease specificity-enhancing factor [Gammaproteobacteria bacterium]MBU1845839.1 ClpXP protease specificity-enhancing factor [Gammaproteobacteria bacterium]